MRLYEYSEVSLLAGTMPAIVDVTQQRLTESEETDYLSNAVAVYCVPISRCDVRNGNGRVYPRAAWEKALSENSGFMGALGMMNHPPKDKPVEDMRDIGCVWGRGQIDQNGIVWWDMLLTGFHGSNIDQALRCGARIGLSSVADGDVDASGNVLVSTFSLVRPADIVYNPSQKVFASATDRVTESEEAEANSVQQDAADNAASTDAATKKRYPSKFGTDGAEEGSIENLYGDKDARGTALLGTLAELLEVEADEAKVIERCQEMKDFILR